MEQVLYCLVFQSLHIIEQHTSDSLFSFVTELISPDDLLRACSLWEKFNVYVQTTNSLASHSALESRLIKLYLSKSSYYVDFYCSPVMLKKFESGVMVIQNKSHSDEEVKKLFYMLHWL